MPTKVKLTTLALSILAALAIPSLAEAGVGAQLSKSSQALDAAIAAAKRGNENAFEALSRTNQKAAARAERQGRRASSRVRRAKLLRRAAAQYDANLSAYADAIDEVPADLQEPMVEAVEVSAKARKQIVAMLIGVAERLPEPARTQLLEAIVKFQDGGEIVALLEAFASKDVIAAVKAMIAEQIETISGHLSAVLAQLEELAAMLPPGAAEAMRMAIAMIESHLAQIAEMIEQIMAMIENFAGLEMICAIVDSLPVPVPAPFCD